MTSLGFSNGLLRKLTGEKLLKSLQTLSSQRWLFPQDHLGLRRAQTGHLGRVQARHRSDPSTRRQDPNHPEQGGHDDPPTADEGLWGALVVPLKNPGKSRGRRSTDYWNRLF